MSTQPGLTEPKSQPRNIAVDAYRGFVMLLMMGEVLKFEDMGRAFPASRIWHLLAYNQTHVEWTGMSLHDIIQPSFTLLVGVALPYSIHSRIKRGEGFARMLGHTLWRSFLLVALGIFLRSINRSTTNFTFEDTLTQIGLGYTFAFLLALARPRWTWIAFTGILVGYWLAWAVYPLPPVNFDYTAVGVPPEWSSHLLRGFAAHWNKNSSLGWAFDRWFLNLFPRPIPFLYNGGGYATLSFIPTLATMLLGLVAGRWYREEAPRLPLKKLFVAGLGLVVVGLIFHIAGVCPIVKRIWTPSWTLFSGGVCFLILALFSWAIDGKGWRRPAFPLVVVGSNSMAAYLMAHLFERFIKNSFRIHLSPHILLAFGVTAEPVVVGTLTLLTYWLLLLWMYRNRVFIRI